MNKQRVASELVAVARELTATGKKTIEIDVWEAMIATVRSSLKVSRDVAYEIVNDRECTKHLDAFVKCVFDKQP